MDVVCGFIDILALILCVWFCASVMTEKASQNQKYLTLTFICGVFITLGNLLEYFSSTPDAALVSTKVAYMGKTFIILFALLFSMGFNEIKASSALIKIVGLANALLVVAILSCEYHSLFYTQIAFMYTPTGRGILKLGHGPLFYVWMAEILVGIVWYAVHAVVMCIRVPNMNKETKTRMFLIVVSVFAPSVLFVMQFLPLKLNFDPTSIVVVFMEGFMLLDVKKFGLLDTMQLAQERVLQDTKDGIIVVDETKSHIVFANSKAKELFPELTTGEQASVINRIFTENENVISEKGHHYDLRISEIKNFTGRHTNQGYVAWIFDMTFIDNYTTEMIKLREEAEQANQAKTTFLAHMSHEIRTPMNAIVGFAEIALRIKDEIQIQNYLKNIRESAGTLLNLINEILDISKIESGKMEIIKVDYSLKELIHELENMCRPSAEKKKLNLSIKIEDDVPDNLIGDRQKIQEIILNLMTNAIKYTNEGDIDVRISLRTKTQNHARIHLEVQDSGIGIQEQNYDSVFGAFEQFDNRKNYGVEGTGLGLSIVKRLVDMMEGEIRFESEYGKGTTFILDIKQGLGRAPAEEEVIMEGIEPRPAHVLVVDDNELNCDVAKGILEILGMTTDVANSGMECLEKLKYDDSYELIFMDHMMPEMDGVETLHEIRKLHSKISSLPVVLLTANAVNGVKEQMLEEGFDGFLSKPIDVDELKKILLRFLGKKK